MNKDAINAATSLLHSLLDKQPNLIKPESACASGGKSVADFCAGFIQQYSVLLADFQAKFRE